MIASVLLHVFIVFAFLFKLPEGILTTAGMSLAAPGAWIGLSVGWSNVSKFVIGLISSVAICTFLFFVIFRFLRRRSEN